MPSGFHAKDLGAIMRRLCHEQLRSADCHVAAAVTASCSRQQDLQKRQVKMSAEQVTQNKAQMT